MTTSAQAAMNPLHVIGHSGLFDADYYLKANGDLARLGSEALSHYCLYGWREGRKPNPFFDPVWYRAEYPHVAREGMDPLLHYVLSGEAEGCRPIAWFDPAWYRVSHAVPQGLTALAHYLRHRQDGAVQPMAEFDTGFYLQTYQDVAEAGMDPVEHYMVQGFREARRPFAGFDPAFYRKRYLADSPDENPLLHYIAHRGQPGVHPALPTDETTIPREIKRNSRPGPHFETRRPLPPAAIRRAMVLAYYLPQFHEIPENDAWWGDGFTEWTNIQRGLPRFAGHYQPRIPRDLGHYRLEGTDTLARQIAMARDAGIGGFVFYFYWFNRHRLMEKPLEAFLADRSLDMPFCLLWANENWTRRWDGSDEDVLISQDFHADDEEALILCFARHFADPRYIRLEGRPLLMIYRPALIPDTAETIARWRRAFLRLAKEDPIFVMSQSFNDNDPRVHGMDGAIEFPPHKVVTGLETINDRLALLDTDFHAQVYDYDDIVHKSVAEPAAEFPLIKTACPSWDNDARRQGGGLVLQGSTPEKFESWLGQLVDRAVRQPFFGTPIVCINAWNEWAEGAYLEPDLHFGSAYLNAVGRAVGGFGQRAPQGRLLLVGHDAFPSGAQMLLLQIGRQLQQGHGVQVAFLLLGDGAMLGRYEALAPTKVMAPDDPELPALLARWQREGFVNALVNSAASAPATPLLSRAGIGFTMLIHELPALLQEKRLVAPMREAAPRARQLVFPAAAVRDGMAALVPLVPTRTKLLPQGLYQEVRFQPAARAAIRARYAIPADALLLIGIGYADLRKGFDLFLQLWRQLQDPGLRRGRRRLVHALWLGAMDPTLGTYLGAEIEAARATGRFHLPGHVADAPDHLSAADAFALTSREDPLPSVVMEAMASGLPCIAFENSGGIPELIGRHGGGALVPLGDVGAMARTVMGQAEFCHAADPAERAKTGRAAAQRFGFARYVATLLPMAQPGLRSISVVVPSYNYGRYMAERLTSIFAQSHPVLEIVVLDDASSDDSVAQARATAERWGRQVRIVASPRNGGSVFRQWRRAAELARGDWVWIAEADDAADPRFLARLADALDAAPRAVMAFCDSRAVDAEGRPVSDSYKPYYQASAGALLDMDGVHDGDAFVRDGLTERNLILNASSALFSRAALRAAFSRCGEELGEFRMAGDWRLYIDMLRQPGARLAYVAEPLNVHRRHGESTTHKLSAQRHLGEIARIHKLVGKQMGLLDADGMRQRAYREHLAQQFGLKAAVGE